MKYEVIILGEGKEMVQSDSFETDSGLVVFYDVGEVPEGSKYPLQTKVAAFHQENIRAIRAIK
jgi:hypothetical protein